MIYGSSTPSYFRIVPAQYGFGAIFLPVGNSAAGEHHFDVDEQLKLYRFLKPPRASWDCLSRTEKGTVIDWMKLTLRAEWPEFDTLDHASLDEFIAGIQEDVIVMRKEAHEPAAAARAAYVNVAFASGWCPICAQNAGSIELGFNDTAREEMSGFLFPEPPAKSAVAKARFVWSITPDSELDNRRCRDAEPGHASFQPIRWRDATSAFLRVERQVIKPLSPSLSVFLIRVYIEPIDSGSPRRSAIRDSIELTAREFPRIAHYKGFANEEDRVRLLELLGPE